MQHQQRFFECFIDRKKREQTIKSFGNFSDLFAIPTKSSAWQKSKFAHQMTKITMVLAITLFWLHGYLHYITHDRVDSLLCNNY